MAPAAKYCKSLLMHSISTLLLNSFKFTVDPQHISHSAHLCTLLLIYCLIDAYIHIQSNFNSCIIFFHLFFSVLTICLLREMSSIIFYY